MQSTSARSEANDEAGRRLVAELEHLDWNREGRVEVLVETPEPHRHGVRDRVRVVEGVGFEGDHARKSYYRGRYVPGREVSAVAIEVLDRLGVDPVVVGDNLVTRGVDLAALREGDRLQAGDVILKRSDRVHRPCAVFRDRTSREAFYVVSQGFRGALFVVERGGVLRRGDSIRVLDRQA